MLMVGQRCLTSHLISVGEGDGTVVDGEDDVEDSDWLVTTS